MKKRIVSLALTAVLLISLSSGAFAATVNGSYVAGHGLYIMDFDTGLELYSHNGDTAFVPASITKLMSIYLTYEAIERGEIALDTVVPISAKVNSLSFDTNYYNTVPLYYNETYRVSELIELILVYSASASVVALAELIDGDEASFIKRMNAKAAEWGIDAVFNGCSGIEDDYISPRAIAVLSKNIIADFPQVLESTRKNSTVFHGTTYGATNNLLNSQYYEGADGLKSGTTTNAGYCFVSTAERNGVRLITVVMKSSSRTQRYTDSHILLDYGFSIRDEIVRRETMGVEPFTDVYVDDWYAASVRYAYDNKLFTGTSATTFDPGLSMNRAMMAMVLHRLVGAPAPGPGSFEDVPAGTWYADAVAWAAENDIVDGVGNNLFDPLADITREQMATILYRYIQALGAELVIIREAEAFTDSEGIDDWARDAVDFMYQTGVLSGKGDKSFDPKGHATRAEVAQMLMNFMKAQE